MSSASFVSRDLSFSVLPRIAIFFLALVPKIALGQEEPSKQVATMDIIVVDKSGKPLEGVETYACSEEADIKPISNKPLHLSNSEGRILTQDASTTPMGLSLFLVAPGKRCDLVSSRMIGRIPTKIILEAESIITVYVFDEDGKPLQDVWVAPSTMMFRESFWVQSLSQAVVEKIQVRTDASGKAILRGASSERLQSITVSRPGQGTQLFQLPESRKLEDPIEVVWSSFRGSLHCRVLDHQGRPVANAPLLVRTAAEDANAFVITKPKLTYHHTEVTDEKGECKIDYIPVTKVTVDSSYYDHRQLAAIREGVSIESNRVTKVELQYNPVKEVSFSILDTSEFETHPGIEVIFVRKAAKGSYIVRGLTDEDGKGVVYLSPGTWEIRIQEWTSSLPRGYVVSGPLKSYRYVVPEEGEPIPTTPLTISKGRILEGKIQGVDLTTLRADWIVATIKKESIDEKEFIGRYREDGSFEIPLPLDVEEDAIECFAISHSPVTNRQELKVVSRNPWLLEGKN